MPNIRGKAFAGFGGEKMIYDMRMGPQALLHKSKLYVVYPANPDGPIAHPHIIVRDMQSGEWSSPQRLGSVSHVDHHYCPICWFDSEDRLHVLYGCHGHPTNVHLVGADALAVDRWVPGPTIAPSISYPHLLPMADGKLVLYYRALGHMGYWAYQVSTDGGFTWTPAVKVVDFDRDPETHWDSWAGSYHTIIADPGRRALHIGFVFLDEQRRLNPLYNRRFRSKRTINRYHLYYAHLDLDTGQLANGNGLPLVGPLSRKAAEACKIWDAGWQLTMQPAMAVGADGLPRFLLPVSGKSPWACHFHFVYSHQGHWDRALVAETNNTWNGCSLEQGPKGEWIANMIVGREHGELYAYGGGDLERRISYDGGKTWIFRGQLAPVPGLLYNNPRHIEDAMGQVVPGYMLLFGWQGPGSIDPVSDAAAGLGNRGQAFLRYEGRWL